MARRTQAVPGVRARDRSDRRGRPGGALGDRERRRRQPVEPFLLARGLGQQPRERALCSWRGGHRGRPRPGLLRVRGAAPPHAPPNGGRSGRRDRSAVPLREQLPFRDLPHPRAAHDTARAPLPESSNGANRYPQARLRRGDGGHRLLPELPRLSDRLPRRDHGGCGLDHGADGRSVLHSLRRGGGFRRPLDGALPYRGPSLDAGSRIPSVVYRLRRPELPRPLTGPGSSRTRSPRELTLVQARTRQTSRPDSS